ncbi:hypothetical protein [Virgibacillus sp. CBA3643]|uniref:hypothetical protein n=1 Tax=Virgibacillus sp. CBA3643 TaxID=2942278 RepID=UPI0035A35F72
MEKEKVTFDEIFKQNGRRIHYHIHKLNIRDPHSEFYAQVLVAMWKGVRRELRGVVDKEVGIYFAEA